MIDRRAFVAIVAGIILAAPLAACAQPAKVARIGFLTTGTPRSAPMVQAFEQRLRELGYTEGQNLVIEFRTAEGHVNRLPGLAGELVGLNADLIVTGTDPATRAVRDATSTIPILMTAINFDPIARGHIASLARPGANVTGVFFMHIDLMARRFELFQEMLPAVSRVAVLSDPLTIDQLNAVQAQNASTGAKFKLQPLELSGPPYDFAGLFRLAMRSHAEAVFALESFPMFIERTQIAQLALKNRLPACFAFREYVEAGGLTSYGVNFSDLYRRVAEFVDKILKGAKPADLPVEQPTKFELVINMKTAKALRLTILQSLLMRADQVIE